MVTTDEESSLTLEAFSGGKLLWRNTPSNGSYLPAMNPSIEHANGPLPVSFSQQWQCEHWHFRIVSMSFYGGWVWLSVYRSHCFTYKLGIHFMLKSFFWSRRFQWTHIYQWVGFLGGGGVHGGHIQNTDKYAYCSVVKLVCISVRDHYYQSVIKREYRFFIRLAYRYCSVCVISIISSITLTWFTTHKWLMPRLENHHCVLIQSMTVNVAHINVP